MATPMDVVATETKPNEPVPDLSNFSLDEYIAGYEGYTRVIRLIFIAERTKQPPNEKLSAQAYALALEEIKKTLNSPLYVEISKRAGTPLDRNWIETVDKKFTSQLEKLEADLNNAKNLMSKEALRNCNMEFGRLHSERGDFNSALKFLIKGRDQFTVRSQIGPCLQIIRASLNAGNYAHLFGYINKAQGVVDEKDLASLTELKITVGLGNLEQHKYKNAAENFLDVGSGVSKFSELVSVRDVAIYGTLCALATYDRALLKSAVINNVAFAPFLDLVPDVKQMLKSFYSNDYSTCFTYFQKLRPILELDIHLHDHLNSLYEKIRSRALIQYFSPFLSVDLNKMAAAFNTTVDNLEKELSTIISDGAIKGRIDSHNKILYALQTDERVSTFEKTLKSAEEIEFNTKALLLRMSLVKNNLYVKPRQGGGDHDVERRMFQT